MSGFEYQRRSGLGLEAHQRAVHDTLKKAGVKLIFAHVSDDVRTTLEKYQITGLLDKDALFDSLRTVVHAYTRTRGSSGVG